MKDNNIEITDYFIAYIDILGYKDKIYKLNTDGEKAFVRNINELISTVKSTVQSANIVTNENGNFEIKTKMFSDNIFLYTKSHWFNLLVAVAHLQTSFIAENLFIRGALYYGKLYANDDFIYGKGLIEAYNLESKVSVFPRIIVDNTFICGLKKIILVRRIGSNTGLINSYETACATLENHYFDDDFDDNKYIDYLAFWKYFIGKDEDARSTYDLEDLLSDHKKYIEINLNANEGKKEVLQKYNWCKNYHNKFCEKHSIKGFNII